MPLFSVASPLFATMSVAGTQLYRGSPFPAGTTKLFDTAEQAADFTPNHVAVDFDDPYGNGHGLVIQKIDKAKYNSLEMITKLRITVSGVLDGRDLLDYTCMHVLNGTCLLLCVPTVPTTWRENSNAIMTQHQKHFCERTADETRRNLTALQTRQSKNLHKHILLALPDGMYVSKELDKTLQPASDAKISMKSFKWEETYPLFKNKKGPTIHQTFFQVYWEMRLVTGKEELLAVPKEVDEEELLYQCFDEGMDY